MKISEIIDFINNHKWTFAKTYEKFAPHEYIVKDYLTEADKRLFEEIVLCIRKNGFKCFFGKKEHIYMLIDGYFYWTMGDPIEKTIILNRAKSEDYVVEMRKK